MQPLGTKKIMQPLGTTKIMKHLGTKESRTSQDKRLLGHNHAKKDQIGQKTDKLGHGSDLWSCFLIPNFLIICKN